MCRLHSHGRNGLEHIIGYLMKRQYLTILCIWVQTRTCGCERLKSNPHCYTFCWLYTVRSNYPCIAKICFFRRCTGISSSGVPGIVFSNFRLSNMHLFSGRSTLRQFHSCWLLFSRHSQCLRNSVKQCLFMSSITLVAHLVTFRPSFMHSSSPLPLDSVLHII